MFFIFIYGDPVVKGQENLWKRLTHIGIARLGAWFIIGDFNDIMGNHEKKGGKRCLESSFLPFRDIV